MNFNAEVGMGVMSSQQGYAQAREAAEKALAIDPEYAPAHAALGLSAMQSDNDLVGAARHLERALALDPTGVSILSDSANLLSSLGRLDQALALHEAAVRRDPVSAASLSNLGAAQCVSITPLAMSPDSSSPVCPRSKRGGAPTSGFLAWD